jgi:hypothetical protein
MHNQLLNKAFQEWQIFLDGLEEESKQRELIPLENAISANTIHYLASVDDSARFDKIVSKLPNSYLYQEELVPTIYQYYKKRKLHELAHDYIFHTANYYVENGFTIPTSIQSLIDDSESDVQLKRYRISLERVRNLSPSRIPHVTPEIINDQRVIGMFLLNEIIQATKVMVEKIQGIATNTHENRFNDLLLAILRLRFSIWGWSIEDQPRSGTAPGGKDAGEIDITVKGAGNTITLIEALILSGGDKPYTQKHISKVFGYNQTLDRYYMIVYYQGAKANFNSTWTSYMTAALETSLDAKYQFDKNHAFKELSSDFENVNHLKIGKTINGTNIEMYHVMIDLSN